MTYTIEQRAGFPTLIGPNTTRQATNAEVELIAERDALAQRCRELEHMLKHARMDADTHYADTLTLRAEVEALRQALRSVIVAAGGSAAPEVSTEFLEQAPLEVLALRGKAEKLARDREIASQCAANGGYLCSRDLIELRELLKK